MKRKTARQRIDASREARLWLTTIIAPVVTILAVKPEIAEKIKGKCKSAKDWAVGKFNDLKNK